MKFAVLGQGSIGRRHARILVAQGHEVAAYDPKWPPPKLEVPGVARARSEAEAEAVAVAGARAGVVATPPGVHLRQTAAMVDQGVHVLVEKPVSVSADGIVELADRADAQGVVVTVGMNIRLHPGVSAIKNLLAEGRLGDRLVSAPMDEVLAAVRREPSLTHFHDRWGPRA